MSNLNYHHTPVLLNEVLHHLNLAPNKFYIDCTLGGGGHTIEILKKIKPRGKVLGLDVDEAAVEATKAKAKKERLIQNLIIINDNFKKLKQIAYDSGFSQVDGILLDLGLSSGQLQDQQRGFSFLVQGKLDMRFAGPNSDQLTAYQILNKWSEERLAKIFKDYGEELLAREIAGAIVKKRKKELIIKPTQLVEIISTIYKRHYRKKSKVNPATKVFQALRITVNDEIENLKAVLPQAVELLDRGGRLAVINYHSLEDRIVKNFYVKESKSCLCPPQRPTCTCGHEKTLKIITKKPVTPSQEEILENPRSRSAKLRVAEKIG